MNEPTAFDAREFVASLPARPGVYRMLDAEGSILYVGKAKNLKSRVASYFRPDQLAPKVAAMVRQVAGCEITVVNSDTEALILEYNLIKKHRPRYNILLRDDKSFPYLYLNSTQEFPALAYYRGTRRVAGRLFGPYPNSRAVRDTLQYLQKLFKLRNCEDSYFANRSRPCLQHQIERCSAPCVGLISREEYAADVASAVAVLEGRNDEVARELTKRMEAAAEKLEYEKAAVLRDQLANLKQVQADQIVTATHHADLDVVALATEPGEYCVAVMFIRGGRNLGTSNFFPRSLLGEDDAVLGAFLAQYYLAREAPPEIVIETEIEDGEVLEAMLTEKAGRRVTLHRPHRGMKMRWLTLTRENALQALKMRAATQVSIASALSAVAEALGLDAPPARIECFDISHTGGEQTVASLVVFGPEGPQKSDYRRFNIEGITPGDDYGAMREALLRRFRRVKAGEAPVPDLLLIDGGPGQLAEAAAVLDELKVQVPCVAGVAKGADRRPGMERIFLLGQELPTIIPADSRALHLIQRVRDEAHRFAITGHRGRRAKARTGSVLEDVPGLGPKKRRELLRRFGGLQAIAGAGIEDLLQVRGISRRLAEAIYEHLHPTG